MYFDSETCVGFQTCCTAAPLRGVEQDHGFPKRTAIAQGTGNSQRELILERAAFYACARGVLKVLDRILEEGRRPSCA